MVPFDIFHASFSALIQKSYDYVGGKSFVSGDQKINRVFPPSSNFKHAIHISPQQQTIWRMYFLEKSFAISNQGPWLFAFMDQTHVSCMSLGLPSDEHVLNILVAKNKMGIRVYVVGRC